MGTQMASLLSSQVSHTNLGEQSLNSGDLIFYKDVFKWKQFQMLQEFKRRFSIKIEFIEEQIIFTNAFNYAKCGRI